VLPFTETVSKYEHFVEVLLSATLRLKPISIDVLFDVDGQRDLEFLFPYCESGTSETDPCEGNSHGYLPSGEGIGSSESSDLKALHEQGCGWQLSAINSLQEGCHDLG
jgi:hypothetical protein